MKTYNTKNLWSLDFKELPEEDQKMKDLIT